MQQVWNNIYDHQVILQLQVDYSYGNNKRWRPQNLIYDKSSAGQPEKWSSYFILFYFLFLG